MTTRVRAIYENGQLRLLDPVELIEGQQVSINIEALTEQDRIREMLGDLVRWHDPTDNRDAWVEDEAEAVDMAFRGDPPMSQLVIEDRDET